MGDIISQVHKIVDLVDYQTDSVVSKTLIDKDSGSVTLFAFDKGQKLSEHVTSFDALVHIFEGNAEISISGKRFLLKQGDMIIMPANKPHAVRAVERFKMMLTMIKS
jgi:quercetin dioxygenase-like cupin family protein